MLISLPLPFVRAFVDEINTALKAHNPACAGLSRQRPPEPPRNPAYPTKAELALRLLAPFKQPYPTIPIKGVLADALYGTATFIDTASAIFGGVQVISQLRSNQKVRFRNRTLAQYFARYPGVEPTGAHSGR